MAEVNKISSFRSFSEVKALEKQSKVKEENSIKKTETLTKIEEILDEMGLSSLSELDEDTATKFFAKVLEDGAEDIEDDINRMGEPVKLDERNAFLGARAKAIEEDKSEFEFNGKQYKVTTKSNVSEGNAFGDAVRKAKEAGDEEFEFDGKTYKVEENLTEAIKVEYKRDAKKVLKEYNLIFNKTLSAISMMESSSMLGCIKYITAEAMRDANFHREADSTTKMIKGNIKPLEIKTEGLGGHIVRIGTKTIKEILDKYYSSIANAAGWSGIGIVEGAALYLEQINQVHIGQSMLDKFNEVSEETGIRVDTTLKLNEESNFSTLTINEAKSGFIAIYRVMGQDFTFGPLKTGDEKEVLAMLSKAIQGGYRLMDIVPADKFDGVDKYNGLKFESLSVNLGDSAINEAKKLTLKQVASDIEDLLTQEYDNGKSYEDSVSQVKKTSKTIEDAIDNMISDLSESVTSEGKWTNIMRGVRKGSKSGPWTIVSIEDNTVVNQEHVSIMDAIPANYEEVKKKFPNAKISIEDNKGLSVYNESVINEAKSLNVGQVTSDIEDLLTQEYDNGKTYKDSVSNVKKIAKKLNDLVNLLTDDLDESVSTKSLSTINEADIKTDDEFKEYAFTILKKAFGSDFDEDKAQSIVDGILSKADGDYGTAIGMLTSSLGK